MDAAVVSTAADALPTELGRVASIVSVVVKILVPPETLVGIAVPEATERMSIVTAPELLTVYTDPRTPRIFHGYGIRNHPAGVVLTAIDPVSDVNAMTAVSGRPFTRDVVVAIEDTVIGAMLKITDAPMIFEVV